MTIPKHSRAVDATAIQEAVLRLAQAIAATNSEIGALVLVGIMNRGDVLARRLAATLQQLTGQAPPVGDLDITFHRDDTGTRETWPAGAKPSRFPVSLEGRVVILVDDVLFTGRSIRAAMDELIDYGRPRAIRLAVLVDRGHRELPIQPDYVGLRLDTSREEDVAVRLLEKDGVEEVQVQAGASANGKGAHVT